MQIRPGISRVTTEYGAVLLDEVDGRYWRTNQTAELVLDSIERGEDVDRAVATISGRFDTDTETVRADVHAVLDRFKTMGVITG